VAKGFDSLLITTNLAANRKFGRLTVPERWCAVHGVWAIAAESPIRGYLLIAADEAAVERDYAKQADVSLAIARSTVRKMRQLGMLEMDDDMGVENVHDWHEHQQEPKPSESREAWKKRKRDSRAKKSRCPDDVTRDTPPLSRGCHTPEVEVEVEVENNSPPSPPVGGRRRDREKWKQEYTAWVQAHPPDLLAEEWEPTRLRLVEVVEQLGAGQYEMYQLSSLHPHSIVDGVWLLGGTPIATQRLKELGARKGFTEAVGFEWKLIDCKCQAAVEKAV
jgi:hypothetical protein